MSGSMEFVARNRQSPHVCSSQTAVNVRKKRLNSRICFTLLLVSVFVVFSVGFFAYLYHLDVKWSAEIKKYDAAVKAKFDAMEMEIKRLSMEIDGFKNKSRFPPGETAHFKPKSVQIMQRDPFLLDVKETGLIDLAATRAYKNITLKELLRQIKTTGTLDQEIIEKFRIKDANVSEDTSEITTPAILRRGVRPTLRSAPPEIMDEDDDTDEKEDDDNEADNTEEIKTFVQPDNFLRYRYKRSAELANSRNVNLIDTGIEEFDSRNRSNHTDFSKTSSSQNQSARVDKRVQCNSTPCEEGRKMPILQKSANRRSLQMKKTQSLREIGSLAGSEMEEESIDVIETRKTVVAAHFGADSSKYSIHTHSYYDGNFHLRHPTGEYEDWRPSSWFDELNMNKHFALMNGDIKVHTPGLYFVYAQIFYSDRSDVNGYEILLNKQVVLQCITSTYTLRNVTTKSNTCYTGGVIKCNAGDKIAVKTVDPDKRVMLEASRSFVGMFKIGDFQSVK